MQVQHTPTIAVLPRDGSLKYSAEKLAATLEAVELAPSVAEPRAEFEAANTRHGDLVRARDGMNIRGKQLIDELNATHQRVEDDLLRQFASDGKGTASDVDVDELARNHAESRAVSKVLGKLVEHLIPVAFVAQLHTESRLLFARAEELERVANERFEKTAELMRGAADFETGITVNVTTTFSGVLLQYANELREKGMGLARRADEGRRQHLILAGQFNAQA